LVGFKISTIIQKILFCSLQVFLCKYGDEDKLRWGEG